MSNLAGMLQVIGAGVAGYYQGKKSEDKEAEAKRDRDLDRAFKTEERDRQRQGWEREDQVRNTIRDGQSDVAIEEIPGDAGYNIENMAGIGLPSGATKPAPAGFKVQDQTFADRSAAEMAAKGLNTKLAKTKRTAEGLAPIDPEKAAQYEAHMKQLVSEGTVEALDSIAASRAAPDVVKKAGGKVARKIGPELADRFNSTGKWKVSADTMVEDFIDKNPAGQEFVNSRVIGKDGKPVVEDVHAAFTTLLPIKERMAAEQDAIKTTLTVQQQAEQKRANEAREKQARAELASTSADRAASRGIQMRELKMRENSFKSQTLSGQRDELKKFLGRDLTDDELKGLAGIKSGKSTKAADTTSAKMIEEAVKIYQTNTANPTPDSIAAFRADLEIKMDAYRVKAALNSDFSGLKPDSAGYAKMYQEAITEGKMSPEQLQQAGYPPPGKAAPAAQSATQRVAATVGAGRAPAPARQAAAPKYDVVDLRADPTISAINAGIAKLDAKDPRNVQQLMALGKAKNDRVEQLRQNYGSQTPLLTE